MNRFKREITLRLAQHNKPTHAGSINVAIKNAISQQHCRIKVGINAQIGLTNAVRDKSQQIAFAQRAYRSETISVALDRLKKLKQCQPKRDLHPRLCSDFIAQARRRGLGTNDHGEAIAFLFREQMRELRALQRLIKAPSALSHL